MNLNEIALPVKKDIDEFNDYFKGLMKTKVALLDIIVKYLTKQKGKQVRPILVFLSAQLVKEVSHRSFIAAGMIELLHTATLIHDDVVDKAAERRGIASINVEWNNKIAVLVGDFLLSKGLLISVDNGEYNFLQVTSRAVKRMSEGELLAVDMIKKKEIDEETYFKIIADKTASLMSACCEIGAVSSTDDKSIHETLRDYGEYVGTAFQLKDDLFDYTAKSFIIGKPVGNDIKEKKITLPLIHSFTNAENGESKKIYKMIRKGKLKTAELEYIIDFAKNNGGLDYTYKKAIEFSEKAKFAISNFQDSDAKTSLLNFAEFVVQRNS